jgi:hypothetical protein
MRASADRTGRLPTSNSTIAYFSCISSRDTTRTNEMEIASPIYAFELDAIVVQWHNAAVVNGMWRLRRHGRASRHLHVKDARSGRVPRTLSVEWASWIQLRVDNLLRVREDSVNRQYGRVRVTMHCSGRPHANFEEPNMSIFVKEAIIARRS